MWCCAPIRRSASTIRRFEVSATRPRSPSSPRSGVSSTPRLLGSIIGVSGILGHPPSRATTAHVLARRHYAAGTGSAVIDLIFSIAKREVTFFSGTALISCL